MRKTLKVGFILDGYAFAAMRDKVKRKARKDFKRQVKLITEETAQLMLYEVQENARSRSGLRYVTGAYVASWKARVGRGFPDGAFVATVRSRHPAAWRLEYGFTGRDRLGRNYNQPPFPHFRPAYDKAQEQYHARLNLLIDEFIGK